MAYGIFVAKSTFFYTDDNGRQAQIVKGATVRQGHPVMKGREDFFEPLAVDHEHEAKPSTTRKPPTAHK
jgi:hypothetical protein